MHVLLFTVEIKEPEDIISTDGFHSTHSFIQAFMHSLSKDLRTCGIQGTVLDTRDTMVLIEIER